jgi:recombination protein RecA
MALKFYSSVRMDIRRIQAIKDSGEVTGNRTRVRVKKNKVAPPFRECEFDIMYSQGISKEGDVLDLGAELDIIEKRGSFYNYKGERLAQGRENTKQALRENPILCFEIENAIRRETGLPELEHAPEPDAGDAQESAGDEVPEDGTPAQAEFVSGEGIPAAIEA